MNEVLKVIKSRRSVRKYKAEQIAQESLDMILEAGIYAPSGHNEQPWHFTVIQNKDMIDYINDKTKKNMSQSSVEWIQKMGSNPNFHLSYNAPTLVLVSGRKSAVTWSADCDAAIQNMLLAAESLDIGSVWLGLMRFFFQDDSECSRLGVPEGYQPYYAVALGYKASEAHLSGPKRHMDVVSYIR